MNDILEVLLQIIIITICVILLIPVFCLTVFLAPLIILLALIADAFS